jgi:putative DNA primase/helicase
MEPKSVNSGADAPGPPTAVSAGFRNGTHFKNSVASTQRSLHDELERARSALTYIDSSDHDTWWKVGTALKDAFGDDAFPIFDDWSRSAENYNDRENRARWKSFRPGGRITIATLYKLARDNGWRDDGTYRVREPEELAARAKARAEAEAERKLKQDIAATKAATIASTIWSNASPAIANNPYCRRKSITPTARD